MAASTIDNDSGARTGQRSSLHTALQKAQEEAQRLLALLASIIYKDGGKRELTLQDVEKARTDGRKLSIYMSPERDVVFLEIVNKPGDETGDKDKRLLDINQLFDPSAQGENDGH